MSEPYPNNEVVTCPSCHRMVGSLVDIDGQQWLCLDGLGGLVVRSLHGACACGAPFHWVVADHMLAELVRHVLELRAREVE